MKQRVTFTAKKADPSTGKKLGFSFPLSTVHSYTCPSTGVFDFKLQNASPVTPKRGGAELPHWFNACKFTFNVARAQPAVRTRRGARWLLRRGLTAAAAPLSL